MSSPFETLLTYPCSFTFRLVARARPDREEECRRCVERVLERPVASVGIQPSSAGNWCAVRVEADVRSADEIRAVYAALHALPEVRMLL